MRRRGSRPVLRSCLVLASAVCLLALPLDISAGPPSGQAVTAVGVLTVTVADDLAGSVTQVRARLSTDAGDLEVAGGGDLAALSGRTVRVSGRLAGRRMDATSIEPTDAPRPDTAIGSIRMLFIPTRLVGQVADRSTTDRAAAVFGSGPSALDPLGTGREWLAAASGGRIGLSGDVTPWVSIGNRPADCDASTAAIHANAQAAARAAGYDTTRYGVIVVMFPRTSACWWHGPDPSGAPRALSIQRSNGTVLWLETRVRIAPFEAWGSGTPIVGGVLLHVGPWDPSGRTLMLDAHPATADLRDAPLRVGESIADPLAGVTISPLRVNADGTIVISIRAGAAPPTPNPTPSVTPPPVGCVRGTPVVSATPASLSLARGAMAAVSLSVRNTDAAGCAASAFTWSVVRTSGVAWIVGLLSGPTTTIVAPGSSGPTSAVVFASTAIAGDTATFSFRATRAAAPAGASATVLVTVR
jgi:hypothetical protein